MTEEKKRLLEAFTPPTYEEWRNAAEASLKGASFEKKLITRTYEDIALQPIYRQEDGTNLPHTGSLPGFPPYVRGTNSSGYRVNPWEISQELPYGTPETLNEALRYDMERGQTATVVVLDSATRAGKDVSEATAGEVGLCGVSLSTLEDMARTLDGIDIGSVPVMINAGASVLPVAALFLAAAHQRGTPYETLRGCLGADPLGTLAAEGTLPCSLNAAYDTMAQLTDWTRKHAPNLRTVLVQGTPYHNGGASATQELACALATGVAYLRELTSRGVSVDNAALSMMFSFAIGSNVFMEVAKLRAARLLWSTIVAASGGSDAAQAMIIHARTSSWNKTTYDPYVNMLRGTAEAFAGVVGGTNSLHVGPFDEPVQPPDEFSRRIARNTQIILQQESHLMKVIDPAGGSWYVETLTDSVAQKAWALFQSVEQQGGMLAALQAGAPQEQIAQTATSRAKNIAQRRDIVVGINMYPNLKEKPLERRQPDADALYAERLAQVQKASSAANTSKVAAALDTLSQAQPGQGQAVDAAIEAALAGATLGGLSKAVCGGGEPAPTIQAIPFQRGAAPFEALRQAAEDYAARTGTPPLVFLANMGPIPQHKPRADFSTGFFEVGGFQVITNNGYATVEEAAQAAEQSQAPIVVICSTDDTYPEIVPPLTQQIKQARPDTLVVLAGYPQDQVESYKAAGVDEFVHLRANCYEMLVAFQQKIGVAK